jgi:hypothetical protein
MIEYKLPDKTKSATIAEPKHFHRLNKRLVVFTRLIFAADPDVTSWVFTSGLVLLNQTDASSIVCSQFNSKDNMVLCDVHVLFN